jgi:DNA-binding NarL/FixJ family response regulator
VMDGVEATRAIVASGSAARIIILTTFDLDEYAFAALRAGASGFLLKDCRRPTCSPRSAPWPAATPSSRPAPPAACSTRWPTACPTRARPPAADPRIDALTPRVREVLVAVAGGLSNGEIAERLVLSEATVKTHVSRILAKLELRDRVQIVVFAYDRGLVAPPG